MAETKQARCNGIEQFKGWIEILIEQRYHRMDVREKKVVEWIDIFFKWFGQGECEEELVLLRCCSF